MTATSPLAPAVEDVAPPPPRLPSGRPDLRVIDANGHTTALTVETADEVALCYPDGSRIPVDFSLDAVTDGGKHRRYVADVPRAAHLATGMVIQAGPLMMPVRLHPSHADWYAGGRQ